MIDVLSWLIWLLTVFVTVDRPVFSWPTFAASVFFTPAATPLIVVPFLPSSAIAACESSVNFTAFFVFASIVWFSVFVAFVIDVLSVLLTFVTRASTLPIDVLRPLFTFFSCCTLTASVSAAPAATFFSWRSLPDEPNDTAPPTGAAVPPNTGVPPLFAPTLFEPIAS